MTKRQATEMAALRLRVAARRQGRITEDMAWDAIAEIQGRHSDVPALAAKPVLALARKELAANGERF